MSHGLQLQSGFMTKHLPEPRRERGGYHYHEVETTNHLYNIQVTIHILFSDQRGRCQDVE